jgi:hypothetical protein
VVGAALAGAEPMDIISPRIDRQYAHLGWRFVLDGQPNRVGARERFAAILIAVLMVPPLE